MGFSIQFESHTVEFPLVLCMEHDENVLEYYCQPPTIQLKYASSTGRGVVAQHTPDYFVVRRDGAGWIEAKSRDDLPLLAKKYPHRYRFVGESWTCPPGEEYAATLGLAYKLHSSADISVVFTRNAQFLDDYLRTTKEPSAVNMDRVARCLETSPAITLSDLLLQTRDLVAPDEIYQMIATSHLHVDLSAAPLVEPELVHVFTNSEIAVRFSKAVASDRPHTGEVEIFPGTSLSWDGKTWKIINVGKSNVSLLGEDRSLVDVPFDSLQSRLREGRISVHDRRERESEHSEVGDRLRHADAKDLDVANERMKLVERFLQRLPRSRNDPPERTVRRYVSYFKRAKEAYGNGYIGLLPRLKNSGNRGSKLSDEVRSAMASSIAEDYERLEQPSRFASWAKFRQWCESSNHRPPSYATYCTAIKRRSTHDRTLKRQGRRSAYKHESFYWDLEQKTPRHGDRPFEIAHIDHTQLDIVLTFSDTDLPAEKPWLSIMTDAYSRRLLAIYLTFDEPSTRSCMMLMRDCVRRYGRLPQTIVMDGGPEFRSTYFETILARYECTKKTRPPAKARYGSVCERLFGTTNTQLIHTLRGNTQILKNVRQVTKSNNPSNLALWNLATLTARLEDYLFEVYDTLRHPALAQTPREAFLKSINETGLRGHRQILYDTNFLMLTAPSTPKGTAKIFPGQGVTINYFSYWSEAFRDPTIEGKSVPVRYDPYDISLAWAFVRNRWVECHSQHYAKMRGLSEKQLKIAAESLRRQAHLSSKERMTVTAKRIAAHLTNVGNDEALLRQQRRDRESRSVRLSLVRNDTEGNWDAQIPVVTNPSKAKSSESLPLEFELYGAL